MNLKLITLDFKNRTSVCMLLTDLLFKLNEASHVIDVYERNTNKYLGQYCNVIGITEDKLIELISTYKLY